MNTQTQNSIKNTLTFKMVSEEAQELSMKLQTTIYVLQSNNTLYTTLAKEDDKKVLCAYNSGNAL